MAEHEAGLPEAELIAQGCADLRADRETVAALVVAIAAGRLRAAGCAVPPVPPALYEPSAEERLYDLLEREQGAGAYSRYNALLRSLASHCHAREARAARAAAPER